MEQSELSGPFRRSSELFQKDPRSCDWPKGHRDTVLVYTGQISLEHSVPVHRWWCARSHINFNNYRIYMSKTVIEFYKYEQEPGLETVLRRFFFQETRYRLTSFSPVRQSCRLFVRIRFIWTVAVLRLSLSQQKKIAFIYYQFWIIIKLLSRFLDHHVVTDAIY